MIGQTFGRLAVTGPAGRDRKRNLLWLCACECGQQVMVAGYRLRNSETRSCGCLQRENVAVRNLSHGMAGTRLYRIWSNMLARCSDGSNANYAGRGISVCAEWRDFSPFAEWSLANGYADSLTIERRNNNSGYSPDNCCWATRFEQAQNKRPRCDGKLTPEAAAHIRKDSRPQSVIARDRGVCQQHISRIKSGQRWAMQTPFNQGETT